MDLDAFLRLSSSATVTCCCIFALEGVNTKSANQRGVRLGQNDNTALFALIYALVAPTRPNSGLHVRGIRDVSDGLNFP